MYTESGHFLLLSPFHHYLSPRLMQKPPNCFFCCCPSLFSIVCFEHHYKSSEVWLLLYSDFQWFPISLKVKSHQTDLQDLMLSHIFNPSHYLFDILVLSTCSLLQSHQPPCLLTFFFFFLNSHTYSILQAFTLFHLLAGFF